MSGNSYCHMSFFISMNQVALLAVLIAICRRAICFSIASSGNQQIILKKCSVLLCVSELPLVEIPKDVWNPISCVRR